MKLKYLNKEYFTIIKKYFSSVQLYMVLNTLNVNYFILYMLIKLHFSTKKNLAYLITYSNTNCF